VEQHVVFQPARGWATESELVSLQKTANNHFRLFEPRRQQVPFMDTDTVKVGVTLLTLTRLNEATQAWGEQDYKPQAT
jgi:hypothetical protein